MGVQEKERPLVSKSPSQAFRMGIRNYRGGETCETQGGVIYESKGGRGGGKGPESWH